MFTTKETLSYTGRANTSLMLSYGDCTEAVVTTINVRVRDERTGERVRFMGPTTFEGETAKHIIEVVLPVVDSILAGLNLHEQDFEISVDAASIMATGLNISDFSADVPILLSILSASLQIPIRADIISIGHVSSPYGEIRMVKNIAAMLQAAVKDDSLQEFIHPKIAKECRLDTLSQEERQIAVDALIRARRDIKTIAVQDTGELVREAFSDEQGVLASLRQGFYMAPVSLAAETGIERAIQFLAQNEKGFWAVLERQLLEARYNDARDMLLAFVQFYIDRKTYPEGLGRKLFRLIKSLPPRTRLKLDFPPLHTSECIQLSQFANKSDHEDVKFLFRTNSEEKTWQSLKGDDSTSPSEGTGADHDQEVLQSILSKISPEALANRFSSIDTGRATYIMDSVTVNSYEEFSETAIAFYIHLKRHTERLSEPVDMEEARGDAIDLLERAFSKKGGLRAALAEAKTPVRGGLRFVLDNLTDEFKKSKQEKYVNYVLKSALEPLDQKGKKNIMGAFMKRLDIHLEPEIRADPGYLAPYYEVIIKAYVQSMERIKSLLRSL